MVGVPSDILALQTAVAKLQADLATANAERASLAARLNVVEQSLRGRVQTLEETNAAIMLLSAAQRDQLARQQVATASMAATLRERAPVADYVAQQRQRVESRMKRRRRNRR